VVLKTEDSMKTRQALLAATLLAGGAGVALAQGIATYDPNQLPALHSRVAQYSLTPRGDVDGLILDDGTQVHLPPHPGGQLVQVVKPGETVTIRGLRAQAIPLIQALSVTSDASEQSVVDTARQPRCRHRSRWPSSGSRCRAAFANPCMGHAAT
jgi:hypothetical protein